MYNNKNADGYVILVMVNSHSEKSVKNYIDKEFLKTGKKGLLESFLKARNKYTYRMILTM